jgi:hypothetical protein
MDKMMLEDKMTVEDTVQVHSNMVVEVDIVVEDTAEVGIVVMGTVQEMTCMDMVVEVHIVVEDTAVVLKDKVEVDNKMFVDMADMKDLVVELQSKVVVHHSLVDT